MPPTPKIEGKEDEPTWPTAEWVARADPAGSADDWSIKVHIRASNARECAEYIQQVVAEVEPKAQTSLCPCIQIKEGGIRPDGLSLEVFVFSEDPAMPSGGQLHTNAQKRVLKAVSQAVDDLFQL